MHAAGVLFLLLAAVVGRHSIAGYFVGGWHQQDPWGNVKYLEMVKFAIKQEERKSGFSSRYAALWLYNVQTQVVSGMNYKIRFKVARRPCMKGGFQNSIQPCKHANHYAVTDCTAIIYDQPWTKTRKVTSFSCKKKNKNTSL